MLRALLFIDEEVVTGGQGRQRAPGLLDDALHPGRLAQPVAGSEPLRHGGIAGGPIGRHPPVAGTGAVAMPLVPT